jgi:membrane associated rhomboid family serine protease
MVRRWYNALRVETTISIIPARSERQAMDWSLVLVSQGIENIIEGASEEHGWQLLVAPGDCGRALQALRQYRLENRNRIWVQPLPWTGLIFDWRSVVWFAVLAALFLVSEAHAGLREAGSMDNAAVGAGQWWRLFTATMLHIDAPHLIANTIAGVLLLGLAMGSYGAGVGLLAAYLAGAGGNVAGWILYGADHRGLGASGMVMGALGLLTVQWLALLREGAQAHRLAARGVLAGILLLVLWGMNPASDVIAHVGGFCTGALLGAGMIWVPEKTRDSLAVNRSAELVCGGLALFSWWLAVR